MDESKDSQLELSPQKDNEGEAGYESDVSLSNLFDIVASGGTEELNQTETIETTPPSKSSPESSPDLSLNGDSLVCNSNISSVEDKISARIQRLENSHSPQRLFQEALKLQDINTSLALFKTGNLDEVAGPEGRFPIHEAAIMGNEDLFIGVYKVRDIWLLCSKGKTALEYAAFHGQQLILEKLLAYANFENGDPEAFPSLERAIEQAQLGGHDSLADLMIHRRWTIVKNRNEGRFLKAVGQGDTTTVKELLEVGISVRSALTVSIKDHLTPMTSLLLSSMEHGHVYNVDAAVDAAAREGKWELTKLLLSKISPGRNRRIAAYSAMEISSAWYYPSHESFIKPLVDASLINRRSALKYAASHKDLELITWLIRNDKRGSIDRESLNEALHLAITLSEGISTVLKPQEANSVLLAKFLLESGAEVNSKEKIWGSALRRAIGNKDLKLVEFLLSRGANVHAKGFFGGSSPLMIAISIQNLDMVRLLLKHGASPHDQTGGIAGNALQTASFLGHRGIFEELLKQGADIDARLDPWGTPLILALQSFDPRIAKDLLFKGADIRANIPKFGTALHHSTMLGMEEFTKSLIEAGADVNAEGGVYCTSLQAAVARGHRSIALLLLDHGADVNVQGGCHGNALQAAQDISDGLLIKLLLFSGAKATKPIRL